MQNIRYRRAAILARRLIRTISSRKKKKKKRERAPRLDLAIHRTRCENRDRTPIHESFVEIEARIIDDSCRENQRKLPRKSEGDFIREIL